MIKTIAVIGAGTMGHGIALTFALGGYPVALYDVADAMLGQARNLIREELHFLADEDYIKPERIEGVLGLITTTTSLAEAASAADYIIEAAPEKLELKHQLLRQLDELASSTAIFASNTSSLPLAEMSRVLAPARQARFMVCHWYNPAHLMPIAELSCFGNMPETLYEEVAALYARIGKQTVKVLKDIPGLVANRIQQGVAREVFWLIQNGIAGPEDIDRALKFGPAFRYATTGQLEVADFGGIDIWCSVSDNLLGVMDNSRAANPLLRDLVAQGKLGVKSGEGFFKYPPDEIEEKRKRFMQRLLHQLKASSYYA